jgi:hypothetical protein
LTADEDLKHLNGLKSETGAVSYATLPDQDCGLLFFGVKNWQFIAEAENTVTAGGVLLLKARARQP